MEHLARRIGAMNFGPSITWIVVAIAAALAVWSGANTITNP